MVATRTLFRQPWILALSICLTSSIAAADLQRWVSHGPYGGTVLDLVASQHPDRGVYACVPRFGVCRLPEGETRWINHADGFADLVLNVLAEDPDNPNILYAGTDHGVYKSIDGGAYWQACHGGLYCGDCRTLAVDPANPQVVYAGAVWAGDLRVYKTTDGGDSWLPAHAGIPDDLYTTKIVIDPTATDTVYLATEDPLDYAPESVGIYKTTDGGQLWTPSGAGLPNKQVQSLAIDPLQTTTLYAGTVNCPPYYSGGMSVSHDGGATWTDVNTGLPLADEFVVSDIAIAHEPELDSPTLYLVGSYQTTPMSLPAGWQPWLFKSTDEGANWIQSGEGIDFPELLEVLVDPHNPQTVYAGTRCGGVYHSTNAGANWSRLCLGLKPYEITAVTAHPSDADTVLVGAKDAYTNGQAGVYATFDGGLTWTPRLGGMVPGTWSLSGLAITPCDQGEANTVFASVAGSHVYRSDDFGLSWTVDPRIPYWAMGVYVDYSSPSTLYIPIMGFAPCWPEIHRSTDCGDNWTAIADSIVSTGFSGLAIEPGNAQTVYAGSEYSGIYKTVNGGNRWTLTGYPSDSGTAKAMAIDPRNTDMVYAGDCAWASDTLGVMVSSDGGAEWESLSDGLPRDVRVEALALDASVDTPEPVLYAGGSTGVYRRLPGGTWQPLNRGLIERESYALALCPAVFDPNEPAEPRALYLGTRAGAYRLVPLADLDGDGAVELADLANLLAHYGETGVMLEDGDLDEDGDVDLSDLAILLGMYGTSLG
jgi:photosystem II stability/assembly factor-like uncharacterized protein